MARHQIIVTLIVETDSPDEFAENAASHLMETFNDDDSIIEAYSRSEPDSEQTA